MAESRIALPLPRAMEAIEAAGQSLAHVKVTGPPGSGRGEGVPRVVRERETSEGIELTVAFPVPPPASGGER